MRAHHLPEPVALLHPQAVGQIRGHEAPGDDLVEAQVPHHVLGAAAQELLPGEDAHAVSMLGKGPRQPVEAVEAPDLLDQVGLAGDVVVAVDGHRSAEVVLAHRLDLELEALEVILGLGALDVDPEQAVEARAVEGDHVWSRDLRGLVDRAGHEPRATRLHHQARRHPLRLQREVGVKLLLEPGRGLRPQAEHARGAEDVDPVPGRDLEQHAGGRRGDLRALAAHDPRDAGGPIAVADEHRLGVEGPLDPVERGHPLAVRGRADRQRAVGHPIEVEGMKGLRRDQHHVIGDVDDIRDRALPARDQARLQPQRRGPHGDVGEHPCREARTELRRLDGDRGVVLGRSLAARLRIARPGHGRQRGSGDRVNLAGDAVDAEAIGAVRVQIELEDGIRDRQDVGKGRARGPSLTGPRRPRSRRRGGGGYLFQDDDPSRVIAELELGLGEDHAVGHDAAQLRPTELLATRQDRPGQRHRDRLTGGHVRRPTDDRPGLAARVHLADREPVGVGMPLGRQHPSDHEALRGRHADVRHALDLHGAHREQLGDLLGRQLRIAVLRQP